MIVLQPKEADVEAGDGGKGGDGADAGELPRFVGLPTLQTAKRRKSLRNGILEGKSSRVLPSRFEGKNRGFASAAEHRKRCL